MTYYIASSSLGLGSESRDPDHPSFPSHEQPIASGSYLSMPEHEPSPFRSGSSITTASSPGEIPSVTEGPPDLEYPAPDFADPQLIRKGARYSLPIHARWVGLCLPSPADTSHSSAQAPNFQAPALQFARHSGRTQRIDRQVRRSPHHRASRPSR